MKRITKDELKHTKCTTTTLYISLKIKLFLKTNLTIERLSTWKKYDMKEAFHITKALFSGLKHEKKKKNVKGTLVTNPFHS